MGLYTSITRSWLESRFQKRSEHGVYQAHMPVYGVGEGDCEGNHLGRLARILRLLREMDGLRFSTLLDVGGAEGYLPWVAKRIFGVDAISSDLSLQACLRAKEIFGLPSLSLECNKLPFPDKSIDVVVCSEVIEHVEHPVETILELQRVARVAVLLSTEELHHDRAAIDRYLFTRPGWPHMERNLFHADDMAACFPGAAMRPQCDHEPPGELPTAEFARQWLLANTQEQSLDQGCKGVVVMWARDDASRVERRHADEELVDLLLASKIERGATAPPPRLETLLARLCDPDGKKPLALRDGVVCAEGGASYPTTHGVPDFVRIDRPAPTRIELADRLAIEDPERRDALLHLRDRLYLPDRWANKRFDFRETEDRRGFWVNDQLRERGEGQGFAWHSVGPDPWLVTPCIQRSLREVWIEMRVHAPGHPAKHGVAQVFWKGAADDTFDESRSVKFLVPNDGQTHVHRVVLEGHPLMPAEVQWLRIDPIDGACEVDLVSLELR